MPRTLAVIPGARVEPGIAGSALGKGLMDSGLDARIAPNDARILDGSRLFRLRPHRRDPSGRYCR